MESPSKFHPQQTKRKPVQKAGRSKAQELIEPVQSLIPRQFRETRDTEPIARYVGATRPSTQDVVISGHEDRIGEVEQQVAAIEQRLGMGKATSASGRLSLVRRSA